MGGGGAGRLKWAGEFFLPIFRAGEFFFAGPLGRIIFFNLPELFSLNRGGGGGGGGGFDIQVLHLPEFFQNFSLSQKYFLFIMRKVISQV